MRRKPHLKALCCNRGAGLRIGPQTWAWGLSGRYSKRNGVLGGDLFGVSGTTLYRGTTAVGTVTGDGPVSIAGNETGIMVCAGDDLHT